jgi:signal transduction histidine kinase
VILPNGAEGLNGASSGAAVPLGFPFHELHGWLAEHWAEDAKVGDFLAAAPQSLQVTPWNIRTIAVVPARKSNGPVAGALCLLNPNERRLADGERRALHLIAEALLRALRIDPLDGQPRGNERTTELNALLRGVCAEDPQHAEEEAEACEHYERMERFEGALLGLVKAGHDDLGTTLRLVTEVAAGALSARRVEIWLFDDARSCLQRRESFPPFTGAADLTICAADCPRFFAGLDAQLVMAIANTFEDPRGQELMARLAPSDGGAIPDLGAALIVPIWLQGRAAGVLAHFHGGSAREWSRDEQDFSGAVAGIVALALEADAHRNTEAQLHALAAHLDAVREEERAGLARELHDELGQMLTALRMDAAWLGKACTAQPEKLMARGPERVQAMKQLLDEAVATVQRISSDLRPGPLHELGLVAALEWQLTEFNKRSGILTSLAVPEGEVALGERTAIALYRALQEALTNVARHAAATEVRATLRVSPQRISLEIRDNGKGISEQVTKSATSLGLIGMRERAAALGGEVVFRGAPGQGTAVLVSLPNPVQTESAS